MWDFARVAADHRHAASHGLNKHAAKLLLPPWSRLAGRREDIHHVQVSGHGVVPYSGNDPYALIVVLCRPRAQVALEFTSADEKRSPRGPLRVECSRQKL